MVPSLPSTEEKRSSRSKHDLLCQMTVVKSRLDFLGIRLERSVIGCNFLSQISSRAKLSSFTFDSAYAIRQASPKKATLFCSNQPASSTYRVRRAPKSSFEFPWYLESSGHSSQRFRRFVASTSTDLSDPTSSATCLAELLRLSALVAPVLHNSSWCY